jgi:hypothetical protein
MLDFNHLSRTFLVICVIGVGSFAVAQNASRPIVAADRESSFGTTSVNRLSRDVIARLIRNEQFDLAVKYQETVVEHLNINDTQRYLAEWMALVEVTLLQQTSTMINAQTDVKEVHTRSRQLLRLLQDRFNVRHPFLNHAVLIDTDAELYLRFATAKAFTNVVRELAAIKLATFGNQQTSKNATEAVAISIDDLNALQKEIEARGSALSATSDSIDAKRWLSEFYRLANEVVLLQIDVLATSLDAASDEAGRVSAAANLKSAIDLASTRMGDQQAYGAKLNVLRAKCLAATGDSAKAIELLDFDLKRTAEASQITANRVAAIHIELDAAAAPHIENARSMLVELLRVASTIAPEIALAVFRYDVINADPQSPVVIADDGFDADSLRDSMNERLSAKSLLSLKEMIGQQYGKYWRYRAEALLLLSQGLAEQSTEGLDDIQVQQDIIAGRFRDAVTRLQTIEADANTGSDAQRAMSAASQRLALLYRLLQRQEEKAIDDSTKANRLALSKLYADTSIQYVGNANASNLMQLSLEIAKPLLSDTALAIEARKHVYQVANRSIENFASDSSIVAIIETTELIMVSQGDIDAAQRLWETYLLQLATDNAATESLQLPRDRRSTYRIISRLIGADDSSAMDLQALPNPIANLVRSDDYYVDLTPISCYWSDQLIESLTEQPIKPTDDSAKLTWLVDLASQNAQLETLEPVQSLQAALASHLAAVWLSQKTIQGYDLAHDAIKNNLDRSHAFAQQSPLWKMLVQQLESSQRFCEAVGNQSMEESSLTIDAWKQHVSKVQSKSNLMWYGRLLATVGKGTERDAVNLFTRLGRQEAIGSPEWLRLKSDLIDAVQKIDGEAAAVIKIDEALALSPQADPRWKAAMINRLSNQPPTKK